MRPFLFVAAFFAVAPALFAAPEVEITFEQTTGLDRVPNARNLAAGAGVVWFTDERFTPHSVGWFPEDGGTVRSFPVPCDGCANATNITYLEDIAVDASGNGWFIYTEVRSDGAPLNGGNNNYVGKMTQDGVFTKYTVPTTDAFRRFFNRTGYASITPGPGGMWFTENVGQKVGKIDAGGNVTEYSLPSTFTYPSDITAGADGNLWFANTMAGSVSRITPAGTLTSFNLPNATSTTNRPFPNGVAADRFGNIYATARDSLYRVTGTGVIAKIATPGASAGQLESFDYGGGTDLVLADPSRRAVSYVYAPSNSSTAVTEEVLPGNLTPYDLAVVNEEDGDATLWVTAISPTFEDTIVRATVEVDDPCAASGISFTTPPGRDRLRFVVGKPYSLQFGGSGGVPPYTFSIGGGALPGGLTLTPAGLLHGTAFSTNGTLPYVYIAVTDSRGCSGGTSFEIAGSASCDYTIDAAWAGNGTDEISMTAGTSVAVELDLSGEPPFTIQNFNLPAGLTWSMKDHDTISITGIPAATAVVERRVTRLDITDANGCTSEATVFINLYPSQGTRKRAAGRP